MSRFFSSKYANLTPYEPGEQPNNKRYIKLNTNESPYPPSDGVKKAVASEAQDLNLYSDPECRALVPVIAKHYGLSNENVLMTNGSDETLNFAFMAFCDDNHPIVFPDISYGFYPVFAEVNHIPYEEIPLESDFTIDYKKYCGINKNIVIANPNAPTGILLSLEAIEEIVKTNPNNIVIIDEAYIDFGGESAVSLIPKYDNLLVIMTYSKSRSMAGARLGIGMASAQIINDMNTVKYSTNPYNVNRLTQVAGIAAINDSEYYKENCQQIMETRTYTTNKLKELGFDVLPSSANFVFAKSDRISGLDLYEKLKENGILIRHFEKERIRDYNRITIGTRKDMDVLLNTINTILQDK